MVAFVFQGLVLQISLKKHFRKYQVMNTLSVLFLHAKKRNSEPSEEPSANEVEILSSRSSQSPDPFPTPEPTYMSSLWYGRVYEILEKKNGKSY